MPSNKIPDRYEKYSNMGRPIPGTRFISFKVPLNEGLSSRLNGICEMFTPRDLMDHCPRLGLIIDFTFTTRYYDPEEFKKQNIDYCKIFMPGRQIPHDNSVKKFFSVVDKYLEDNMNNDKIIGVHCTHGLNRTGYMVCRYMIQRLKIPSDQAISDFNSARGHEQEHAFYLNDLREAKWINHVFKDKDTDDDNEGNKEGNDEKNGDRSNSFNYDRNQRRYRSPRYSNGNDDFDRRRSLSLDRRSWTVERRDRSRSRSPVHSENSAARNWNRSPVHPENLASRNWSRSPVHSENSATRNWNQSPVHPENLASRNWSRSPVHPENRASRNWSRSPVNSENRARRNWRSESSNPGRAYYDNYYGNRSDQYDPYYYQKQGCGLAPYVPNHIAKEFNETKEPRRPRQYRGPRQYRSPSPPREVDNYQIDDKTSYKPFTKTPETFNTPLQLSPLCMDKEEKILKYTPRASGSVPGPARHPLSPGAYDEVFSPDNTPRRSLRRYNPY